MQDVYFGGPSLFALPCLMSSSRFAAFLLLTCLMSMGAQAQETSSRFFVESSLTQALYLGERDRVDASLSSMFDNVGFGPSAAIGFQVLNRLDASLRWLHASYPGIRYNSGNNPVILRSQTSLRRTTLAPELHWRLFSTGRLEWDFLGGWTFVRGVINDETHWARGPVFGGSLSYPIGSFAIGVTSRLNIVGPDDALDGSDEDVDSDVLASAGLSLRWNIPGRTPRPHLEDAQLSTPGSLVTDETGVFMIETNLDPADYSVSWSLGDGTSTEGSSISHAYAVAGAYRILATITTSRRSINLSSGVTVLERIVPAEVRSITVTPPSPADGDTLWFVPTITGSDVYCDWDFGDGRSSSDCEPWHVFARAGTYPVKITVSNAAGSDSLSRTVRVRQDVCRGLTALTPVYFPYQDPELALEMREILRENFASASRCPDRTLVISGQAFDNERNAEDLALDRARAVMQYYLNLGLASSNIRLGRATVHQRDTWNTDVWRGRQATTQLVRRTN